MDINRIRQFRAIVETGNLGKSAELLYMTPGALSKAMKQLQLELGVRLFQPLGRGIVTTDLGQKFYVLSETVLDGYERMVKQMREETCEDEPIRIATFEVFSTYFLGHMLEEHFAGKKIRILERTPGAIEQSILNREADIGVTYVPIPHPQLSFSIIGSFEFGIFARKGAFKGVSARNLPFAAPITTFKGSPSNIQNLDNWPSEIPRKVSCEFETLETALETTRRGVSAVFCPKFVVALQNRMLEPSFRLEERSLPNGMKPVKRKIYLLLRKTDSSKIALKTIFKAFRKEVNPLTGSISP